VRGCARGWAHTGTCANMRARDLFQRVAGDTGPATHPGGDVSAPTTGAGASDAPWQHLRNKAIETKRKGPLRFAHPPKAYRPLFESQPTSSLSVFRSLWHGPTRHSRRTHRHAKAGAWGSCCCRHVVVGMHRQLEIPLHTCLASTCGCRVVPSPSACHLRGVAPVLWRVGHRSMAVLSRVGLAQASSQGCLIPFFACGIVAPPRLLRA
jgi:hypothetical protein